jgi:SAM-dependent methyltransferase
VSEPIRFDDGAAYERYMGKWSRLTGSAFLEWLRPQPGLRWLDVGCGNGAFTELIVECCTPASVYGIDPSQEQLAYAHARRSLGSAQFRQADAMALPFQDDAFDVAVMPLVIFFVPDPAKGVAEMVRVVCPGGCVSAYAWDMAGDGFPYELLRAEMREFGLSVPTPPSPESSALEALGTLWVDARLEAVETRQITVHRIFADFGEYWTVVHGGPSVSKRLASMAPRDHALLEARMRKRLTADASGRITCSARANAVMGRVPRPPSA